MAGCWSDPTNRLKCRIIIICNSRKSNGARLPIITQRAFACPAEEGNVGFNLPTNLTNTKSRGSVKQLFRKCVTPTLRLCTIILGKSISRLNRISQTFALRASFYRVPLIGPHFACPLACASPAETASWRRSEGTPPHHHGRIAGRRVDPPDIWLVRNLHCSSCYASQKRLSLGGAALPKIGGVLLPLQCPDR